MSKLSLDALKERAEATASTELLATISGGTANSCHLTGYAEVDTKLLPQPTTTTVNPGRLHD